MTYTPKTKVTEVNVDDFLETVSEKRRNEAYKIISMMRSVSGEKPVMWGPTMIGFGSFHYISKSGSEADWFKIGFSPRKAKISFYISMDADEFTQDLEKFGKHTRGKGCIYVNKLEDIDFAVLEKMTRYAYVHTKDFDARKE